MFGFIQPKCIEIATISDSPSKSRDFFHKGVATFSFFADIPDVQIELRRRKKRIFPHGSWDEPPLIFVYWSRRGDARSGDVARSCGDFSENADTFLFLLAIYPVCDIERGSGVKLQRCGAKKTENFMEDRSHFQFFWLYTLCADCGCGDGESPMGDEKKSKISQKSLPIFRITYRYTLCADWHPGVPRGWHREKISLFFYDPVVGFAEFFRRDSMGRKKRDFFRESLSDFNFFADIPNVRNRLRTADATKKWGFFQKSPSDFAFVPRYTQCAVVAAGTDIAGGDEKNEIFLRKHRQFSCLFPDIPCVQVMLSGRMPWVMTKKSDFLRNPLPDS